jgi:trans-aconitate 2-methyltransferase|tara:strand:- start:1119 stop:1817 length:699 start_codon:yes stop_codon:yes gene_type:complete
LLARVPLTEPARVYDLGCGAGNVTRALHRRWPEAELTGVDSSPEMLERAQSELPAANWQQADLAQWRTKAADVIYSNAALHWLGNHQELFPALFRMLTEDGVLAVQMPRMFDAPSHRAMRETAQAGPWRHRLEALLGPPQVAPPEFYYQLLAPHAVELDIWECEYLQILEGPNPVLAWTQGTALRPFLAALEEPERSAFEADFAGRLAALYPPAADGCTLFPFRRLFMVARK